MQKYTFTALIRKEGSRYSSLCLELDVASCGDTLEEAMLELKKAVKLYLKVTHTTPSKSAKEPIYITQLQLA